MLTWEPPFEEPPTRTITYAWMGPAQTHRGHPSPGNHSEVKGYLRALRQIYAKSSEKCLATGPVVTVVGLGL